MTAHPIDTEALRRLADAATPGPWEVSGSLVGIGRTEPNIGQTWGPRWRQDIEFIAAARTTVPALLDALAAAEHRATRAEAQSAIRGRAVVMYRERAREALAQLDAAEQRIRDLTQDVQDERGACLDQMEQVRIRDARIKAVRDVLDEQEAHFRAFWAANGKPDAATPGIPVSDIRRALNGYTET